MSQSLLGRRVRVGGLYEGLVEQELGVGVVVVLDDPFTALPGEQCWFGEDGRVRWLARRDAVELRRAQTATAAALLQLGDYPEED